MPMASTRWGMPVASKPWHQNTSIARWRTSFLSNSEGLAMKRIGLVFERSVKNNAIQRFRNPQYRAMNLDRRSFLAATAAAGASSLLARPALAAPSGFGELRQIDAGLLNIGYVDLGPRNGPPV